MKKTYYDENSSLNEDGSKVSILLDQYFEDIFSKEMKKGYSLREITQIIYSSVSYVESKKSVEFSEIVNKQRRSERAAKGEFNPRKREPVEIESE
jgi:hypothetical protein